MAQNSVIFCKNLVLECHCSVKLRQSNVVIGNVIKMSDVVILECLWELVLPHSDIILLKSLWKVGLEQAQGEGGVGRAGGQELSVLNIRVGVVFAEVIETVLHPVEGQENTERPENGLDNIQEIFALHVCDVVIAVGPLQPFVNIYWYAVSN